MAKKKGKGQEHFRSFLSSRIRAEEMAAHAESSPLFPYVMCKKLDGRESQPGTTAWWRVRVDKGYGVCEERLFQYDKSLGDSGLLDFPVTQKMLTNAYQHRIPAYQRLFSLNDIKKVLSTKNTSISLSFAIFEGIYEASKEYIPIPKENEKSKGVHCVPIVSYNDNEQVVIFLNSWGAEWGDKGIGYIPYSYLGKHTVECWARMPTKDWYNDKHNILDINVKNNVGNEIRVQVNMIHSLVNGRVPLRVLDLYGPDGMINGWSHFSVVDYGNAIEIEDIFVLPQYRNLGLGTIILETIEDAARNYGIAEIRGWISVQDIISEREANVRRYFTKAGFEIISDNARFKGSYWRVQKAISNNLYFHVHEKKAPPVQVDEMLNQVVAKSPLRIVPK